MPLASGTWCAIWDGMDPGPIAAGMDSAPRPGRAEYAADAAVHAFGIAAAVAGCVVLGIAAPAPDGLRLPVALGLYATGLFAMLVCSLLYNLAAEGGRRKAMLRRLDHAAIFVMIAGTYSPIALLAIRGAWGWSIFATVWAGALGGVVLKLFAPRRFDRVAIFAYLALGWAGLAALEPLLTALAPLDLGLIVAGGLLYSLGIILHLADRLPFHTPLWHGCVVAAAACHYVVVLRIATAATG